jgi:uncharacterized membrane protein YphA (DoxX/SURF4 family)
MLRLGLALFLIAHGLVHVAIWAPRFDPAKGPFDPSSSWVLGTTRPLAQALAFTAAAILVVAGVVLLAQGEWWRPVTVVGLAISTGLMALYFNPWYLFILAVNVALIAGVGWLDWPARSTVGA